MWIPIVSAIVGGTTALVGREIINYLRKPILEIDFQKTDKKYPYQHERDVINEKGEATGKKMKHLELSVKNAGGTVAENCEAKAEIWKNGIYQHVEPLILRWGRRPLLFYGLTDIDPISINTKDSEPLRFLKLPYKEGATGRKPDGPLTIEAFRPGFVINPEENYLVKVSVFSKNAKPATKEIKINWDGQTINLAEAIRA